MIVECPSCRTRYRTDTAGAPDETTFFECTQTDCGHVFPYSSPVLQTEQIPEYEAGAPADDPADNPADDPPIAPTEPPSPTVESPPSHEEWTDSDASATASDTIPETEQTETDQGEEPLLGNFPSSDAPFFDGTEEDEGRIDSTLTRLISLYQTDSGDLT